MICKKCQTYYVRDPCPNCGLDSTKKSEGDQKESSVKPSQVRQRENKSGNQVLMQKEEDDEKLVKPSERFKKEKQDNDDIPSFQRFARQDEEEHLVKPSERIRKQREEDENIPSFQKFDRTQSSTSKVSKKKEEKNKEEDEIPSFARYQPDDEVSVTNLSKLNKPEQQERLKNDKEYRNQVKETLEEVMGLLEKLIDDE